MNLVLAVVAIPFSIYYGLIPWLQLKATIKVVVIVYLGLLVMTALYNFVRSPLQLLARNNEQVAHINERLDGFAQSLQAVRQLAEAERNPLALPPPDTTAQSVPAEIAATSFEFTNFLIVDRWLSIGTPGLTSDKPDGRDAEILKYPVMLARFYYKPARDVPPMVYVKVHIAIADFEGAPIQPRYDAVWDESSENEYKGFSTAATHALAIALLPKEPGMLLCTYQYGFKSERFSPVFDTVPGKEFVFQLELIGKVNKVTVMNARMRFSLSLEPQPVLTFLG